MAEGQATSITADALPPVQVYTPTGRDGPLIARLLDEKGMPNVLHESESAVLAAAEDGDGPLLVTQEGISPTGVRRLHDLLGNQPPWSDLPVVLLRKNASRHQAPLHELLRHRSVRSLNRPIDSRVLCVAVRLAAESRQRQLEVAELLREQAELSQELRARAKKLQQLTVELSEVEDRERAQLADLLHDDVQGLLVGAQLHIGVAQKQADGNPRLSKALGEVRDLVTEAQRSSRNLSHELYPAALRQDDLLELLAWLGKHAQRLFGIDLRLSVPAHIDSMEPHLLRFCYRALREVLRNAAKHAGVNRAELIAQRRGDTVELTVADRGVGFDPDQQRNHADCDGMGLLSIKERIETLGGELLIDSQPDAGSRITLRIPLSVPSPTPRRDSPRHRKGRNNPKDQISISPYPPDDND